MATLNSNQIKLATGLIQKMGFKLVEFNAKNVLKLQNGLTTIYLYPKKTQNHGRIDH